MIVFAALVVGVLFAVAVYLLLSQNTQRLAFGYLTLTNAVNLLVLTAAGLPEGAEAPILRAVVETPGKERGPIFADPLPQAFVLTAIVIGLGATSLLLALAARTYEEAGVDSLEAKEP